MTDSTPKVMAGKHDYQLKWILANKNGYEDKFVVAAKKELAGRDSLLYTGLRQVSNSLFHLGG
jgi:hypothetical protein